MTIYVSNLDFTVGDDELKRIFTGFGEVTSAKVMTDKFSNRSRGFGFVEMPVQTDGEKAIAALNGTAHEGRTMIVNEARPRK
ncbi:MAG TPA: RNA-binding protein [Chitinophagaceae bacterium]|nr:RNA-binding protein [Chitinophagaceae bacterium]